MKSIGMRSLRMPLAILMAFALVVSGIIYASPLLAARAAEAPPGHVPNSDIVLRNPSLSKAVGGEYDKVAGPLVYEGQARFEVEWDAEAAVTRGTLAANSSFSVTAPAELRINRDAAFPILLPSETLGATAVGNCYPTVGKMVCVFDDRITPFIEQHSDVLKGTVWVGLKVYESPATVNFGLNGAPTPVALPENKAVVKTAKPFNPTRFTKSNDGVPERVGSRDIRWYYLFSGKELATQFGGAIPNTLTITDTLAGNHSFFSDDFDFYVHSTKDAPEMPWVSLVRHFDPANGYGPDGKSVDNVTYGTFTVDVQRSEGNKKAVFTITKTAGEWDPNALYKFLYRTRIDGEKIEGLTYGNTAVASDPASGLSLPARTSSATLNVSAGATAQIEKNYGTFRVTKAVNGNTGNLIDAATTMKVNVAWQLPSGKTEADYPLWAPASNPVQMTVTAGQSTLYTSGNARPFPIGTTITLTELMDSANPALPSGTAWKEPHFVHGANDQVGSISFTVGERPAYVSLINTVARESVSVGDYVWFDANKDGKQDPSENGLAGAVLKLTYADDTPVTNVEGQVVDTYTTKDNGYYVFDKLPVLSGGKKYKVTMVTPPAGYVPTVALADGVSADLNSNTDSVVSEEALDTDLARDMTLDFGFIKPSVSVGNLVWFDANKNGLQDAGESGIENVTLTISRSDNGTVNHADGTPFQADELTTTTNPQGEYSFGGLEPLTGDARYVVTVTAPEGYQATEDRRGNDTEKDSDAKAGKATAKELSVNGASDNSLDFGFIKPAVSVGNFVWFDANKNGLQDADESGIENVTLTISRSDDAPVKTSDGQDLAQLTTTTNNQGHYEFTNLQALPAGTSYVVTVTTPEGYQPTEDKQGSDTEKDSEAKAGKARSKDLTTDGASDNSLDFGFIKPAVSVGNFVWFDTNKNGLQDDNEPGIKDVILTISRSDKKPVKTFDGQDLAELTATTNEQGLYEFTNLQALPAGTSYVVTVTKLPRGLAPTVEADDDDAAKDSSAKTGIATSGDLTVDGASDVTLDFGYVHGKVSVGDRVWFDTNKNGLQDDGEPGVEGATLTIARTDGKPVVHVDDVDKADAPVVAPVVTQADGLYVFENLPILPEGVKYKVSVQVPAKYAPTEAGAGADRAKDSSTGEAEAEELAVDGAEDKTLDFGFVSARVSVGDFVWFDANKDGKQDDGEPGIEGVKLTVLGPDGQPVAVDADGQPYKSEVVTDKAGKYLFENLPVLASDTERYTVKVVEIGAEYTPTVTRDEVSTPGLGVDNDSSKGQASTVKPLTVDKRVDDTLDFGFVKSTVYVGDYVWYDVNRNGKQDRGERGLPGVWLSITGPDGKEVVDVDGVVVESVPTNDDGQYVFANLPVLKKGEKYTVTVVEGPKGYVPTRAHALKDDTALDSSTGSETSGELLNHGDHDLTLDFGYVEAPGNPPSGGVVPPPTTPDQPGTPDKPTPDKPGTPDKPTPGTPGKPGGGTPGKDVPSKGGKIARTGADAGLAAGVATVVVLVGAAGVLARRRATQ